jgi:hypothetical protein
MYYTNIIAQEKIEKQEKSKNNLDNLKIFAN